MSKILVLGDTCDDVNYYGEVKKISPEAPIPIFNVISKETIPGMAENVVLNLQNAGNEVVLMSKDMFPRFYKTVKSRYFAGKHYLYRIDEDETSELYNYEEQIVLDHILFIKDLKGVVLQDYNKGFFNRRFVKVLIGTIRSTHPDAIIVADGHKSRDSDFYGEIDYLKLNEDEYNSIDGLSSIKREIIVTYGKNPVYASFSQKTYKTIEVESIDATGAGDTFTAWFTSEIVEHGDMDEAIRVANIAAGISVTKLGCFAPTKEEIEAYNET